MHRRRFLVAAGVLALTPQAARALPALPRLRRLSLANPHTGETFAGPYRNDSGPIPRAMEELSIFLRDFHCGATTAIDVAVVDFLAAVLDAVGESKATILSAYRTPATNAMLARTTFGVAEHSQHIYGRALDIRLETRLLDAMNAARAMRRGGVGWYPRSGFIHIDSGPVRNWTLDESGLDTLLSGRFRGLGIGRTRRPLTVAQRLALQRRIAWAEYLARHR